ncbi:MAG: outer membrane protein assembly factor BamE [Devosiaceae bacterium]|nr:outer membrane protein assembly factor BamE [Devosiaceae bacterium MH13]
MGMQNLQTTGGTSRRAVISGAVALTAGLALSACVTETRNHGFIMPADGLEQVPVGSSRDQVLIVLGTPQTTATLDNEVFYYISQRTEQTFAFSQPQIVDQRVVAVYFGEDTLVERVANYGLQDGVVFDFVSNTTPTGGRDLSFLGQVLTGVASPTSPI